MTRPAAVTRACLHLRTTAIEPTVLHGRGQAAAPSYTDTHSRVHTHTYTHLVGDVVLGHVGGLAWLDLERPAKTRRVCFSTAALKRWCGPV